MAEIKGYIIERQGLRAKVKIDQEGSTKKGLPKYMDCLNAIEASAGLLVEIEMRDIDPTKAKYTVVGIPIIAALAGLAFGRGLATFFEWPLWTSVGVSGAVWFLVGINYASSYKRDAVRKGEQPTIVAVIYDEENGGN